MSITKNRKTQTIIILTAILLLLLTGINVLGSYINTKSTVKMTISNNSIELAKAIASSFDTESYQRFLKNPEQNEDYWKIRNYLYRAKENTGALYVYVLKIDNPKVSHVMITGFPPELKENNIGMACTVPEELVKGAYYHGTSYFSDIIDDGKYGKYISAGAPIKDDDGKVICFLAVDIATDMLNTIFKEVMKKSMPIFVFSILFTIIVIISITALQKWYRTQLKSGITKTEEVYEKELHSLFHSIKSLRHDFINHLQVVHGLLKIKSYDKAFEYVDSLSKEVKFANLVPLNIQNPALLVLFQKKWVVAQSKQIEISFDVSDDHFQFIKTTDIIKIFSNLIDNAMDAAVLGTDHHHKIEVVCYNENDHYLFEVANSGKEIPSHIKKHIFESGFSTKQEESRGQRGQGLYIVKEIVEKYDGNIFVYSNKIETKFRISIPIQLEQRKESV